MDLPVQAAEDVGQLLVQVYAIHGVVIQETGGMEGLHDAAMMHAASNCAQKSSFG